jgi:hypothetical protein
MPPSAAGGIGAADGAAIENPGAKASDVNDSASVTASNGLLVGTGMDAIPDGTHEVYRSPPRAEAVHAALPSKVGSAQPGLLARPVPMRYKGDSEHGAGSRMRGSIAGGPCQRPRL